MGSAAFHFCVYAGLLGTATIRCPLRQRSSQLIARPLKDGFFDHIFTLCQIRSNDAVKNC